MNDIRRLILTEIVLFYFPGIIDCSNVNCAHHCPADSYFTHLDDLIPAIDLSKTQMKESTSESTYNSALNVAPNK